MSSQTTKAAYQAVRAAAAKRRAPVADSGVPRIHVGMATCGIASGALETKRAFEEELASRGIDARVHPVGCMGHCYAEPVVVIDHPDSGFPPILYPNVSPGKAKMLTKLFLQEGDPRFEHVLGATVENEMIPWVMEFARFSMETRVVTGLCGKIDPESIDEYLLEDGYAGQAAGGHGAVFRTGRTGVGGGCPAFLPRREHPDVSADMLPSHTYESADPRDHPGRPRPITAVFRRHRGAGTPILPLH